jgi:hypothetical protein
MERSSGTKPSNQQLAESLVLPIAFSDQQNVPPNQHKECHSTVNDKDILVIAIHRFKYYCFEAEG